MTKFNFLFVLLLVITITSCSKKTTTQEDPIITHRDSTVNPADDFFMYANGNWFKQNPIPASERYNGIFRTIGDTINAQIKQICEKSAKMTDAPKGSNEQKIGDFYTAGMDTATIEKLGISPLTEEINKIKAVKDIPTLLASIAHLHSIGANPAFSIYVAQDDKISDKYAVFLSQGGLTLGNRDYYFNTDKETENIRNEYVKHIQAMAELAGYSKEIAQQNAAIIMKMETEMAQNSRKLEALRDPIKNYNKMSLEAFSATTPNIDWKEITTSIGLKNVDSLIVGQPEFYKALNQMVKSYSIENWKTYLEWQLLDGYAGYLNSAFEKQNFYFFSTVMSGVKEQKPRWKRIVEQTNSALGELIGQIYVKEYLPKGSKEKLLEIGNNIRDVYAERIKKLDWMSEETKKKALFKLSKIVMKVGYPDKWKDLSGISIDRKSYIDNIMAVNKWAVNDMVSKYGKPVDRTEWDMQPQTYNAYYNPSNNEICVPACNILVPGFEGRMPDDAILYSIIGGSTFGHEITHGFDDQGSQYDEKGNLNNWWTAEDLKKFQAKTKLIVDQYNEFEALPGKFVNGDATQGENIADLGGIVMGYEAFKKTAQYKNKEIISGLSPEKRFFLGYAYAWMVNYKTESLAQQLLTDVHSPAKYRINGPLQNMPEFFEAFGIKPGSKMRRADDKIIVIW
ncbi:MAG TPA: M13 family metallopeptidase [Flavobacterium sp.]|jgi:putative endopeptidase|uniref:M13 family metallopeptidase n=1 Tax=Flavobacterium sp. TaxID=239 RepID=UPI002C6D7CBC|nr:M13 family metallopeptidase [Flavobacterium sp.]HPW98900.1 M13 family metallopeptidase [Flavobacterium sp.]HQA73149.1 M13 family metallopeptidase [Flavobacterium sp.]